MAIGAQPKHVYWWMVGHDLPPATQIEQLTPKLQALVEGLENRTEEEPAAVAAPCR